MAEQFLIWLLVPLGMALGWYLRRAVASGEQSVLPADLAQRSWAESDTSDEVLSLLRLSGENHADPLVHAEAQLQLGSLFRKRGQMDRAMALHQSVVAREHLPAEVLGRACLELAVDYEKSGLFDRAESMYLQLAERGIARVQALEALRSLHEQTHEWAQAWDSNQQLQAAAGRSEAHVGLHYACELAELALRNKDDVGFRRWLDRALDSGVQSPRPWLLRAAQQLASKDWEAAAESAWRVIDIDPRFAAEALPTLAEAYAGMGQNPRLTELLAETDVLDGVAEVQLLRARLAEAAGEDGSALLAQSFVRKPSWSTLGAVVAAAPLALDTPLGQCLQALQPALSLLEKKRPRYRCTQCGMQPGRLFWQCPSCLQWGTTVPLDSKIVD